MTATTSVIHPDLDILRDELRLALGDRLSSLVLYGSAARGDYAPGTSDLNVLVVVTALNPAVLEEMNPAVTRWERRGQSPPRLFTPGSLRESADVFPIEFMDLKARRIVLSGDDPIADVVVHPTHLRLQCERELREKLMRLQEGYVTAHTSPRQLGRLLAESYTTFVALFRGCLWLHGDAVPDHDDEVVAAFCEAADLDAAVFDDVGRLRQGGGREANVKALFGPYHAALVQAIARTDRFAVTTGHAR